jgi:hypothetical protein
MPCILIAWPREVGDDIASLIQRRSIVLLMWRRDLIGVPNRWEKKSRTFYRYTSPYRDDQTGDWWSRMPRRRVT